MVHTLDQDDKFASGMSTRVRSANRNRAETYRDEL